jgi:hypothetical protein
MSGRAAVAIRLNVSSAARAKRSSVSRAMKIDAIQKRARKSATKTTSRKSVG